MQSQLAEMNRLHICQMHPNFERQYNKLTVKHGYYDFTLQYLYGS